MKEFQREVAEVQWWLDSTRRRLTWDSALAHDFSFCEARVRGSHVRFSDQQHAMLRLGANLWPARIRLASQQMGVAA